jgi:hypothetical protein
MKPNASLKSANLNCRVIASRPSAFCQPFSCAICIARSSEESFWIVIVSPVEIVRVGAAPARGFVLFFHG